MMTKEDRRKGQIKSILKVALKYFWQVSLGDLLKKQLKMTPFLFLFSPFFLCFDNKAQMK